MDNTGSGSATYYGEVIWCQELPELPVSPNTLRIEQDWCIRIPDDCPPTIRIGDSRESSGVLWGIDTRIDIPGVIRGGSVFCFSVEPEVV